MWAGPSKPAHVRREDTLVTQAMSVARLVVPKPDEVEHDYPRQRIWYGSKLIADCPPGSEKLKFRVEMMMKVVPGFTIPRLEEAEAKAEKQRAEKRAMH